MPKPPTFFSSVAQGGEAGAKRSGSAAFAAVIVFGWYMEAAGLYPTREPRDSKPLLSVMVDTAFSIPYVRYTVCLGTAVSVGAMAAISGYVLGSVVGGVSYYFSDKNKPADADEQLPQIQH